MAFSLSDTLNKAISYLQANELEKAEQLFQAVLLLKGDNIDALHLLGVCNLRQGKQFEGEKNLNKAIQCCEGSLKADSNNLQLNLLLSYLFMELQNWSAAEQSFRQTLQYFPNEAEAYNGLGSIYFLHGKIQKAFSMYYQALKKDENNIEALYNQGLVLRSLGRLSEAEIMLSQAVKISPQYLSARASLGLTYQELGKYEEAMQAYRQVLEQDSNNDFALHMLSALEGKTTDKAPASFVAELFDAYAPSYEHHLQAALEFQAPTHIVEALDKCAEKPFPFKKVLDLGCGTGLLGEKLRHRAIEIEGVDLSLKMLNQASNKKLYHLLHQNDIDAFLKENDREYDCCIASDVFIYLGGLNEIFSSIYQSLNENGVFVFTTELYKGKGYSLLSSGRYAHSSVYIGDLAKNNNFNIVMNKNVLLRKEEGAWIEGQVYYLTKL